MEHRWTRAEIRAVALKEALTPLWRRRREFAPGAVDSPLGLLPIKPELIIREILRLKLEEPEEIVPDLLMDPQAVTTIGGVLNRERSVIAVARRLSLERRRFTMVHEVGHYLMHPALIHHREVSLSGAERSEARGRPRREVEADLFAAEVLMPRRSVRDLFMAWYGGPVSVDEIDENLCFHLSMGVGWQLRIDDLMRASLRERSRIFAAARNAASGTSLKELFLVTQEAMAFRLEELNLVI